MEESICPDWLFSYEDEYLYTISCQIVHRLFFFIMCCLGQLVCILSLLINCPVFRIKRLHSTSSYVCISEMWMQVILDMERFKQKFHEQIHEAQHYLT